MATVGEVITRVRNMAGDPASTPDSDGDLVTAVDIYSWLNSGLGELGRITGGILDQTGAVIFGNQTSVILTGHWVSIDYVWYNGWLTLPKPQSYIWQQSGIFGSPSIITVWQNAIQQVLGLWPIAASPNTGDTTLTAGVAGTTTLGLNVVSTTGFVAPGLLLLDNDELIAFDDVLNSTQLVNLVRGVGGTQAVTHSSGATVVQCALRLVGRRLPIPYAVGNSTLILDLPQGWSATLDYFLLSNYKQTEQNVDEALKLMQMFQQRAQALKPQIEDDLPEALSGKQERAGFLPLAGFALPFRTPRALTRQLNPPGGNSGTGR